VTVSLYFQKTSNANNNTLGWYDPANPTVLHPLLAGSQGAGASVTFIPTGIFGLYSSDGIGQIYASVASANQNEAATQQHFALLVSAIPEPGTGPLAGIVLAAAWAATVLRKNSSKAVRHL
jgi:hypothetical protein